MMYKISTLNFSKNSNAIQNVDKEKLHKYMSLKSS